MRRWSLLASLLVLVAPAGPVLAATLKTMTGDPPPDLAGLIAAERRFAARAGETSIRDAFFEALDADGIVFRPTPVNGKEFFGGRPSNPGPRLVWEPTYAEISQSGELGWTTGPFEFTNQGEKQPSAYGHFATVWRYGLDRKWHVLIDFGHSHPRGPAETLHFARLGGEKGPDRGMSLGELSSTGRSLYLADAAYSRALADSGMGAALARWGDAGVRVYRDGRAPILGAEAAGRELAHEWDRGVKEWHVTAGAVSQAGDLGFTYGTVDLPAGTKDEPAQRNVLRIWHRDPGQDWQVALDVTLPVPPGVAAPPPPTPAKSP